MSAKVLVIGLDSADRDLLLGWAATGVMPVLGRLLEESISGSTNMPPGLGNEAMWFSFCTGVNPARHGVYSFEQIKSGSYDSQHLSSALIKQEPFWQALSRGGKRVCIIDAPRVPLSQSLNGVQLCRFMSHANGGATLESYPQSLASEVTAHYGAFPNCPCSPADGTLGRYGEAEFAKVRDLCVSRPKMKAELVGDLLKREPWDLFFVGFVELHCAGHDFWHFHDPKHPRHNAAWARDLGDPIEAAYRAVDAAIGRILECVDENTSVIIFSGPGMGPNHSASHMLDEILRRLDHSPATASQSAAGAMKSAWQLLPLALRRRLSPLIQGAKAGVASAELRDRRSFALIQQAMHGAIRVNRVGREPHGKIEPGPAFDRFCDDLTADLMDLRNLESGAPAVRKVLRTAQLYRGEHLDQLPDLLVLWNQDTPIEAVSSPKFGELTMANPDFRTGEHFDRVLFAARCPGIAPGESRDDVAVEDFAATVAALLGTTLPDLDGTPIQAICPREPAPAER